MFTKKLNTIILITSQILNFLIILYFAVLLAKSVWWVINPSIGEVYIEKSSATQYDKSIKYINNRYPFGIIAKVVTTANAAPPIAQQIKVSGIYYNPPKDSIAFVEYDSKAHTIKVGGNIMDSGATLKAINPDSIVVVQNGESALVSISHGSGAATSVSTNISPRGGNSSLDSRNNQNSGISPGNSDDFKERRKKLMEEFAQREQTALSKASEDSSSTDNLNNTANSNNGNNANRFNK